MKKLALATAALVLAGAQAQALTVTRYDIVAADISGTGNWSHSYSGTITPTAGSLANYSGGLGTLTDGVVPFTALNNQLFLTATAPVEITFYFDDLYTFSTIEIFGASANINNNIPGNVSGFDVAIGGMVRSVATTGFGPGMSSDGQYVNDRADLVSAGLSGIAGDKLTLSNFLVTDSSGAARRFNIGEVSFTGSPRVGVVPLPLTLPLLISGVAGLALVARRRTTSHGGTTNVA